MDNERLETKLIQQQNRYIRQLEEQIAVYEKKDKAQELLIEKLNLMLDLLTEELSAATAKNESKEGQPEKE